MIIMSALALVGIASESTYRTAGKSSEVPAASTDGDSDDSNDGDGLARTTRYSISLLSLP